MSVLRRQGSLVLGAMTVALYAGSIYMGYQTRNEDLLSGITWGGSALTVALIGALIARRLPGNRIGWLLLASGFFETLAGAADLYGELSATLRQPLFMAPAVSWIGGSTWAISASILLVFLPLYFPTGRPPSPRWRWVGWLGLAGVGMLLISTAFVALVRPELMGLEWEAIEAATGDVQWLFSASELGFPLLMAAGPLAVLSLIVRFVRSRGVERQQIKVLAYAGALTITFIIASNVGELPRVVEAIASAVAMPSLGIATMVAILRHGLYDIDRLVSRTLTYALLTLLLVGLYLVAVTTLTAVTAPVTRDSPVAVAAATLLAAAAFQPARRRIQAVVDRRFNRARYDARQTVEAFASSLRQEVDLDGVNSHLVTTVTDILSPTDVAVWLRPGSTA